MEFPLRLSLERPKTCLKCLFSPIALRKDKIVCNFGLSECSRLKPHNYQMCILAADFVFEIAFMTCIIDSFSFEC